MSRQFTVADITHPYYDEKFRDWQKWRYTYEGGQRFIDNYLTKFSNRESNGDYSRRRGITYNPAFAKAAVNEVKNSIFQRLADVIRTGGSETYSDAVTGLNGGIDLVGSSMNSFIGRKILPELLTMSRVGVYVDMPNLSGVSIADTKGSQPYVYVYRAEDIRSWTLDETNNENEFTNILLRDYVYSYDDSTGLPSGLVSRYRRMWLDGGKVKVKFYNEVGSATDIQGLEDPEAEIELNIPRIPFVIVQLSDSLLADVANYQIALLNLASSDLLYTLQSNYPFYTEQYDPRAESMFTRRPGQGTGGESGDAAESKPEEIVIGTSAGRRYPATMERPGFIHPSPEPLMASMSKQDQLKREIRELVALSVANMAPKVASAESKAADQGGLENGLSYIGLELENMERKLAGYWAMYEKEDTANIFYPENWTIKSEAQKREESDQYEKQMDSVPSPTFQKEAAKQIVRLTLGRKIPDSVLEAIEKEIDSAPGAVSDPLTIQNDVIAGILDLKTAAKLRGYPKDTVDKAVEDHAARLERIATSQSENATPNGGPAARGVPEADPNQNSGKAEKAASKDSTTSKEANVDNTRGPGKSNKG